MKAIRLLSLSVLLALAFLPLSSRADLTEGLIGYWSFDDGTATDGSAYGHHGTVFGEPQVVEGVCGQAFHLDGEDDYINLGNPPGLNPTSAMSLVAWFKPDSYAGSGNTPIIDKGYTDHQAPFYQYHLGATGDLYGSGSIFETDFAADGVWCPTRTPTHFWTPGNWYFVVSTWDGSTARLYVDGVLINSSSASGSLTDYGSDVYLGKFTNLSAGANLPGIVDEIRIYERALDESEILSLHENCESSPDHVYLDIKPGSCPNAFSLRPFHRDDLLPGQGPGDDNGRQGPKGVLPVAVLGTEDFDATSIDPSTIALEGIPPLRWSFEDVGTPVYEPTEDCDCTTDGSDGYDDLTLKFAREALADVLGRLEHGDEVALTLTANLFDGTPIEGVDCVIIKGGNRGDVKESASAHTLKPPTGHLIGNRPNPFNPATEIMFDLDRSGSVKLEVLNLLGQTVCTLVDGYLDAGEHGISWDASDQASGVYFYRLTVGDLVETEKMILLK